MDKRKLICVDTNEKFVSVLEYMLAEEWSEIFDIEVITEPSYIDTYFCRPEGIFILVVSDVDYGRYEKLRRQKVRHLFRYSYMNAEESALQLSQKLQVLAQLPEEEPEIPQSPEKQGGGRAEIPNSPGEQTSGQSEILQPPEDQTDGQAETPNSPGEQAGGQSEIPWPPEDQAGGQSEILQPPEDQADGQAEIPNSPGEQGGGKSEIPRPADDQADGRAEIPNLPGDQADGQSEIPQPRDSQSEAEEWDKVRNVRKGQAEELPDAASGGVYGLEQHKDADQGQVRDQTEMERAGGDAEHMREQEELGRTSEDADQILDQDSQEQVSQERVVGDADQSRESTIAALTDVDSTDMDANKVQERDVEIQAKSISTDTYQVQAQDIQEWAEPERTGMDTDQTQDIKEQPEIKRDTKLLLTHSCAGGSGKTLCTLALCAELARLGKRVCYINTESIQDFPYYLADEERISIDLAQRFAAGTVSFPDEIYRELGNHYGFDYLKALPVPAQNLHITGAAYSALVRGFQELYTYDVIVAELPLNAEWQLTQLYNDADRIIMVCLYHQYCAKKTEFYVRHQDVPKEKYMYICNRVTDTGTDSFSSVRLYEGKDIRAVIREYEQPLTLNRMIKEHLLSAVAFVL